MQLLLPCPEATKSPLDILALFAIDLAVDPIPAPHGLADYLDHTVGVVEHGLFLDMCDEVIIAHSDGTIEDKIK